jgi:hypothetical protein
LTFASSVSAVGEQACSVEERLQAEEPASDEISAEDQAKRDEAREQQRAANEAATAAEEADALFRQMHNEGIKDTFTEIESEDGSASDEGERTRLALWWHRQSERFSQWRHDFREKADEWRDRLQQQEWRIRRVFGWGTADEEREETPAPQIEAEASEHDPPEQPPSPEPPDQEPDR